MIANIIVDIEPLLVYMFGLRYPLHGYLHTFLCASILGLFLGLAMYTLEPLFRSMWRCLLLEPKQGVNDLKQYLIAGVIGTNLHVLLDSPLYIDIRPFFPLMTNPLFNPMLTDAIYSLCMYMGIAGLTYYMVLVSIENAVVQLTVFGAIYITLALYLQGLRIAGLRDIPSSYTIVPLVIGLYIVISTHLSKVVGQHLGITLVLMGFVISVGWLLSVIIKMLTLGVVTPLVLSLITSLVIMHTAGVINVIFKRFSRYTTAS